MQNSTTIVSIIPALVERDAVAENNVTNLLAVLRQTVAADASVKADQWEKRANFVGRTLFNKTVGVIGVGNRKLCRGDVGETDFAVTC